MYISGGGGGLMTGLFLVYMQVHINGPTTWGGGAYKQNFMVTNYPLYLPSVRPRWLS